MNLETTKRVGLVMIDLAGGDYSFTFVDESRWEAIVAIDKDESIPDDEQEETIMCMLDPENKNCPGTITAAFFTQSHALERVDFGHFHLIGVLCIQAT